MGSALGINGEDFFPSVGEGTVARVVQKGCQPYDRPSATKLIVIQTRVLVFPLQQVKGISRDRIE